MTGKILQQRAVVYIRAGEHSLFTALERLMLDELDAVTIVDKRERNFIKIVLYLKMFLLRLVILVSSMKREKN